LKTIKLETEIVDEVDGNVEIRFVVVDAFKNEIKYYYHQKT
jgi:hypothetical protein